MLRCCYLSWAAPGPTPRDFSQQITESHPIDHDSNSSGHTKGKDATSGTTSIEADEHLHRCLVYIDLNMIRAGMFSHPREWAHSDIMRFRSRPRRYAVIDLPGLMVLCGFVELAEFQEARRQWIREALESGQALRDGRRSEVIAVGSLAFVENVKNELGNKRCTVKPNRLAERMCCGNEVKLTQAI